MKSAIKQAAADARQIAAATASLSPMNKATTTTNGTNKVRQIWYQHRKALDELH